MSRYVRVPSPYGAQIPNLPEEAVNKGQAWLEFSDDATDSDIQATLGQWFDSEITADFEIATAPAGIRENAVRYGPGEQEQRPWLAPKGGGAGWEGKSSYRNPLSKSGEWPDPLGPFKSVHNWLLDPTGEGDMGTVQKQQPQSLYKEDIPGSINIVTQEVKDSLAKVPEASSIDDPVNSNTAGFLDDNEAEVKKVVEAAVNPPAQRGTYEVTILSGDYYEEDYSEYVLTIQASSQQAARKAAQEHAGYGSTTGRVKEISPPVGVTQSEAAGMLSQSSINIEDFLAALPADVTKVYELTVPGSVTKENPQGEKYPYANPLVTELSKLAQAGVQSTTSLEIQRIASNSAVAIAQYNKAADIQAAIERRATDVEIANINTASDRLISISRDLATRFAASQQADADKYVADAQARAAENIAGTQAGASGPYGFFTQMMGEMPEDGWSEDQLEVLNSLVLASQQAGIDAAAATVSAAESQAGADVATSFIDADAAKQTAKTAAGASGPFGFLMEALAGMDDVEGLDTPQKQLEAIYAHLNKVGLAEAAASGPFGFMQSAKTVEGQTPKEQLEAIYAQLNAVGLGQAGAANIAAQNNIFGFAAALGRDEDGNLLTNPNELAQLAANSAAGFAAQGQVEAMQIEADASKAIAQIQASVSIDDTQKKYLIAQIVDNSERAVAAIQAGAQQGVAQTQAGATTQAATTQAGALTGVANIDAEAAKAIANIQQIVGLDENTKNLAIATLQADANKAIAALQAGAVTGAATTQAGAASPYGYLAGGGPLTDVQAILSGQYNPFGQDSADMLNLTRAQASGGLTDEADILGVQQAGVATNPYAATQLGQDLEGIYQILRGGLTPEQQRQLTLAGQAGQMQGNYLNYISNPFAVGASQTLSGGTAAPFSQQQLQQVSDSPSGTVPSFAVGLGTSPFALPETQAIGAAQGLPANFTLGDWGGLSDVEQQSVAGQLSPHGITPMMIGELAASYTPGSTQAVSSYT